MEADNYSHRLVDMNADGKAGRWHTQRIQQAAYYSLTGTLNQ